MTTEGEMYEREIALEERQATALERIAKALEVHPEIEFALKVREHMEKEQMSLGEVRHLNIKERAYYRISELAGGGLSVDGAHHKQWILERILEQLGLDPANIDHEAGIAP